MPTSLRCPRLRSSPGLSRFRQRALTAPLALFPESCTEHPHKRRGRVSHATADLIADTDRALPLLLLSFRGSFRWRLSSSPQRCCQNRRPDTFQAVPCRRRWQPVRKHRILSQTSSSSRLSPNSHPTSLLRHSLYLSTDQRHSCRQTFSA